MAAAPLFPAALCSPDHLGSPSLLGEVVTSPTLRNRNGFEQVEKKLCGLTQAFKVGRVLLEVVAPCLGAWLEDMKVVRVMGGL